MICGVVRFFSKGVIISYDAGVDGVGVVGCGVGAGAE